MTIEQVQNGVMSYLEGFYNAVKNKDWGKLLVHAIPVILTVLVIFFLKIPVWKPARKAYSGYRRRRTARRATRKRR